MIISTRNYSVTCIAIFPVYDHLFHYSSFYYSYKYLLHQLSFYLLYHRRYRKTHSTSFSHQYFFERWTVIIDLKTMGKWRQGRGMEKSEDHPVGQVTRKMETVVEQRKVIGSRINNEGAEMRMRENLWLVLNFQIRQPLTDRIVECRFIGPTKCGRMRTRR